MKKHLLTILVTLAVGNAEAQDSCQVEIACEAAAPWRDHARSVALGGSYNGACSGVLLNNTARDGKAYYLTAWHCVDGTDPDGWATRLAVSWNHESTACEDRTESGSREYLGGGTFIAGWAQTDFALVELDALPSNAYFAGWDRTVARAESVVGIHHPRGGVKSIAIRDGEVLPSARPFRTIPGDESSGWLVERWDAGKMESVSSGSPLFNEAGRVIGQRSGGVLTQCVDGQAQDLAYGWYGRLARAWEGGGRPETRLKDWLDPLGTGEDAIDGAACKTPGGLGWAQSSALLVNTICPGSWTGYLVGITGGTPGGRSRMFRRVLDRALGHPWVTDARRAPRGVAGGALVMSRGARAGRR